MSSVLIKNAHSIVTMDENRRTLENASIYIENGEITAIGSGVLERDADRVIDGRRMIVYPGLINLHHHLYQCLTRNIPQAQDRGLFQWLDFLYGVWRFLHPEDVYWSAMVALGELLKSGCTTSVDHFYVFPKGTASDLIDQEIRAAADLGIRFHPTRGSMTRGQREGGIPPDEICQTEEEILKDTRRLIETYHDPARNSMCRVGVAPCAPMSVTRDLMRQSADLARSYGTLLHTHLAETQDEEQYCLQTYDLRPLDFMEQCGWVGDDVWYAHGIWFDQTEIERIQQAGTGIAHCPISNMKLASGTCPVPSFLDAGVPIGLGVDGSASTDSSNLLMEIRAGYLLHRHVYQDQAPTATDLLSLATRGGSRVLGRSDIGSLETGKAADLFMVNVDQLPFAGGLHDPASLPAVTGMVQADMTMVNGRVVVEDGRLVTMEEETLSQRAHVVSEAFLERAGVL